jgi:hypothetical protein
MGVKMATKKRTAEIAELEERKTRGLRDNGKKRL